ncbi:MAG: class I SAM-dependent methyltransferase [Bdellovibrionota bacterium]
MYSPFQDSGLVPIIRHFLPPLGNRAAPILDFGSGSGRVTDFLLSQGFTQVTGFERNESLRDKLSPQARAVTAFGSDFPKFLREYGRRSEAVVPRDVLYYFDNAGALAFLKELRLHFAPNALLLIEVVNGACLTAPYIQFKGHGIRQYFTEHSLVSLLVEAGYKVEIITGIKPVLRGPRSIAFYIASRIWHWVLRGIYWAERGVDSQNPRIWEKKIFASARL